MSYAIADLLCCDIILCMEQDLRKLIEENQSLLRKNLEVSRGNEKKIKKIQSHIRRSVVAKYVYWIIVILVVLGVLYSAKPYFDQIMSTYNELKFTVDKSNEIINNPASLFNDVDIVQKIFGS